MPLIGEEFDGLVEEMAGRFQAFSQLFEKLSAVENVRTLFDSRIDSNPEAFSNLIDGFDIPKLDKCFWVSDVIDRIVSTPLGWVEECWLKDNLTPKERLTYLRICIRFGMNKPQIVTPGTLVATVFGTHTIIPAGPFLDELKANGLVECRFHQTYDLSVVEVLGPPMRICI